MYFDPTLKTLLWIVLLLTPYFSSALSVNQEACGVLLSEIRGLEPSHLEHVDAIHPRTSSVLGHFFDISGIFRTAKFEDEIRKHLVAHAERLGFFSQVDAAGNLLIRVPSNQANPDKQPVIALQAHLDMVANVSGLEKRTAFEDFLRDNKGVRPLEYKDGALQSVDHRNTIGNDNGSGVAIMMEYMLNNELPRPNLELLFTVVEEDGLIGASQLELPLRAQKLISLDSGEEKIGLIGSNGATRRTLSQEQVKTQPIPEGHKVYSLQLSDLRGGHSGLVIHEGRANAVREMMSLLRSLRRHFPDSQVVSLRGGAEGVFNAIPKNFTIEFAIRPEQEVALREAVDYYLGDFKRRYNKIENPREFQMRVQESDRVNESCLSWDDIVPLSSVIIEMPDGARDASWPDGVTDARFSTNMSYLSVDAQGIRGGMMPRFYDPESLRVFDEHNAAIFSRLMPSLLHDVVNYSPEWKPAAESNLRHIISAKAKEQGLDLFHWVVAPGSVEGGEIKRIYPDIDVVVIGVDVPNAHEPTETLPLESLANILKLVDSTLRELIVP